MSWIISGIPLHSDINTTDLLLRQRRESPNKMARAIIAIRVGVQIFLMIILCIPPLPSWQHLRHNLPLPPLLVHLVGDFPRNLLLLGIMVENGAAVLAPAIGTLSVSGGGVVHAVKVFDKLAVGDLFRVEKDLEGFGV